MLRNLAQDMAVRCLVEELQRAYATLEAVPGQTQHVLIHSVFGNLEMGFKPQSSNIACVGYSIQ